ncbi:MAG: hypothetical protein JWN47_1513, partial [Frankiales bacterium]|nr:hypothetical protein [Frankiales bacterium]
AKTDRGCTVPIVDLGRVLLFVCGQANLQ